MSCHTTGTQVATSRLEKNMRIEEEESTSRGRRHELKGGGREGSLTLLDRTTTHKLLL